MQISDWKNVRKINGEWKCDNLIKDGVYYIYLYVEHGTM